MFGKIGIIVLALTSCNAIACDRYAKIGAGYKLEESETFTYNGKEVEADYGHWLSARIEIGCETNKWSWGISHHSQWLSGAPFNDDAEYHKTEIFIDRKLYF